MGQHPQELGWQCAWLLSDCSWDLGLLGLYGAFDEEASGMQETRRGGYGCA